MNNDKIREPASSPCGASDADPAYMGLLQHDEIAQELQVLLEAERAGARIAKESAEQASQSDSVKVDGLKKLLADETHCCKVLIECLQHLGEVPKQGIGDFYEKCMAIPDLDDRLALVDKGQRWVLRRVEAMLPRLSEPKLILAMKDIRDLHR